MNNKICWDGDWRDVPRNCGGFMEVWDQTVGCAMCGMNLWYLPNREQWPLWDMANAPLENHWKDKNCHKDDFNPYTVYGNLMDKIHPFQWDDCHDPGDEDREGEREWEMNF